MIDLSQFDPVELGLPEAFPSFRGPQTEFVEWVTASNKRFLGAGLPTGSGKSLSALALARATGLRTSILTVTRGLEKQYVDDFGSLLKNIHGKGNYPCAEWQTSCRFGALEGCRLAGGLGCVYECERAEAKQKEIVLTNYAYWIRINEMTRGLQLNPTEVEMGGEPNPFELLILDEAGKAEGELARSLAVSLKESWLRTAGYKTGRQSDEIGYWKDFPVEDVGWLLKQALGDFKKKKTKALRDRVYELSELVEALERIALMNPEDWVCDMKVGTRWGRKWDFECISPGSWAEKKLFIGVPKVVLIGATLKPAHMGSLWIGKGDREYREWPRVFPAHHTPVYHIPTVKMREGVGEEELAKWVETIDRIIESRLDRKGIIHTVSYKRQQYLAAHSKFRQYMILNDNDPESATAAEVVERFKQAEGPAILVSPSFSTGWDFPYRCCEWQIIAKLAFPALTKVMRARRERNKTYIDQLVMEDLVQACGRGTRAEDDRCEVFIVDDQVVWFMWRNKQLKPGWFEVRKIGNGEIPKLGLRCPDRRTT